MTERCVSAPDVAAALPHGTGAAARARRVVRARLAQELPARQLDDLLLIVSELATNAAVHGVGEISLRVRIDGDGRVCGEVLDQGSGFVSEPRERSVGEVGKRGLLIVATLAERWGTHDGCSRVWFELAPA